MGVAALLDVWGGEAGRAPSGGLRSCACSRTGWGRHHHHHGCPVQKPIVTHTTNIEVELQDLQHDFALKSVHQSQSAVEFYK